MDLDDYLEEALQFSTKICIGEATAMDSLLLRDLLKLCIIRLRHWELK